MTGADSPVIADSSTEATPTTTSPSPGMNSPAATRTRSRARRAELATVSVVPSFFSRRALVSVRALRRVSAWALPRPSAMASAKLAKRTVNHSQRLICRPKPVPETWCARSRAHCSVVSSAPTSTTNITGFFTMVRGWSFRKESSTARRSIFGSPSAFALTCVELVIKPQKTLPACIKRCSRIGARLNTGKKVSEPTMTMVETSKTVNSGPRT